MEEICKCLSCLSRQLLAPDIVFFQTEFFLRQLKSLRCHIGSDLLKTLASSLSISLDFQWLLQKQQTPICSLMLQDLEGRRQCHLRAAGVALCTHRHSACSQVQGQVCSRSLSFPKCKEASFSLPDQEGSSWVSIQKRSLSPSGNL